MTRRSVGARTDERLEADVRALATQIAALGEGERHRLFHLSFWTERLLDWAMAHDDFKTQLFRLVDVFPATRGDDDVLRHIEEYFDGVDVPKALDLGMGAAAHLPFGRAATVAVARRNILRLAKQLIIGSTPEEAVSGLEQLWRNGTAFTVDLLGEKTLLRAEADLYAGRVDELLRALLDATPAWPQDDHLERDDRGTVPIVNVSVKPTALATHYEPLTAAEGLAQAKARLRPILRLARDRGAHIHLDMEHADVKDLTLTLFYDLLDEDEFADVEAGVVIQAYLRDSYRDLEELVRWSGERRRPVTVRLVKGAYWDAETIKASANAWHSPVFEHKAETDANFERCVRVLHENHDAIRAAFGSHNLRSLAYAIAYARSIGIPDNGYELQMLHGMAEPIHAAIRKLGFRLRVYAPVGELVPGMAYLVRRLLENTSNESFVRHRFAENWNLDELLAPPAIGEEDLPGPAPLSRPAPTRPNRPGPYRPEPLTEWRRKPARATFASAVHAAAQADTVAIPALIGGTTVHTSATIDSIDPAAPTRVVARSVACGEPEANAAVAAAVEASRAWSRTPVHERAAVLFNAAEWLRARRNAIAALEVFEAGKPWDQADADVCEAIDFCEYYGRQMLRLDDGVEVQSPPGEHNQLRYQARGVVAVIAPWNFPLAIPCGMTVAALVTGNTVILKPAEQTPAVAWQLVQALHAGGLPPGVLQFTPGYGEQVGAALVAHPDVSVIAFTGSREVGLAINAEAACTQPDQRHVKRVIAEMGGKNAIVVDADADPDVAVPEIVKSAFGFSGQKCSAASRVIVHEAMFGTITERLTGMVEELTIGAPRDMATQVGPLIDAAALAKVREYSAIAREEGTVLVERTDLPAEGFFAGPMVVADLPTGSKVLQDEIFGPVLAVMPARDLDEAITLANDTPYALCAGVFSRSPSTIRRATAELRAGNIYVNRGITGAVVGRQPFGGYGLSGVGSKAGGPDYLLQFLDPVTTTENTIRQGFAPASSH
ncbi:MAG: proline dehydrogenase family protein [Acidimicrobiales bacterium]|nr:proline dehydrogenase family protein [Acidimicrobiales bacterium]